MPGDIIWDQNTIAVVCVFAVPIVAIIAGVWSQVERRKADNELKQSMIDRGMSAEDIERVMAAKVSKR
jgi:signal transduction histidine kinase